MALVTTSPVTAEMLATAYSDQPQIFVLPHLAAPAVNDVFTYRAQFPTAAMTIMLRDSFIRPENELTIHWEKKLKTLALAEFMITGEVAKDLIMEAYDGAASLNSINGHLSVMRLKADPHIALRPNTFMGATGRCETGVYDLRVHCLNAIREGTLEQIAQPGATPAVTAARQTLGACRVTKARATLATCARLMRDMQAACMLSTKDPYSGFTIRQSLRQRYRRRCQQHFDRLSGMVSGKEVDEYCENVQQLGDAVPDRLLTFGELVRQKQKQFWADRFWDIVFEFMKPCHTIFNLVVMLEKGGENLQFILDGITNYMVDGWNIVISQHILLKEMSLSDDKLTRDMWNNRLGPGVLTNLAKTSKVTFYRKVSSYNAAVSNGKGTQKSYQDRLGDIPVFACCVNGTPSPRANTTVT